MRIVAGLAGLSVFGWGLRDLVAGRSALQKLVRRAGVRSVCDSVRNHYYPQGFAQT
jgi:hypothetical protein